MKSVSKSSSSKAEPHTLTNALLRARQEALLYNDLYATTGRQHGPTACQPLQSGEFPLIAFRKAQASLLARNSTLFFYAKHQAVNTAIIISGTT